MKKLLTAAALLVAFQAWSQQAPTTEDSSGSKSPKQKLVVRCGAGISRGEPLYVIDGTPAVKTTLGGTARTVKVMPDIDVNDIESILVLKDSSATALYGDDGANGVIVITTKHGVPARKRG